MKKWEALAISAMWTVILGIVFTAWAIQAVEPINLEMWQEGDQVMAEATLDTTFIGILMAGEFLFGMGIGEFFGAYVSYKLEKRVSR